MGGDPDLEHLAEHPSYVEFQPGVEISGSKYEHVNGFYRKDYAEGENPRFVNDAGSTIVCDPHSVASRWDIVSPRHLGGRATHVNTNTSSQELTVPTELRDWAVWCEADTYFGAGTGGIMRCFAMDTSRWK